MSIVVKLKADVNKAYSQVSETEATLRVLRDRTNNHPVVVEIFEYQLKLQQNKLRIAKNRLKQHRRRYGAQ